MSAVMIALNVSEHSLIKLNVDHCKSFVPQLNFGYYLTCILCDHQDKVDRSMALLRSLGIEKDRWQETSESFKSQMSTLIGDVFLSSAFLAYAGYFDQQSR